MEGDEQNNGTLFQNPVLPHSGLYRAFYAIIPS